MEKEKTGNKIENILDDPKAMRAGQPESHASGCKAEWDVP